jgi:hypothetical protein
MLHAVHVSSCEGFKERREALQQLFGSFAFRVSSFATCSLPSIAYSYALLQSSTLPYNYTNG